jgi:hypothetical protein
MMGQMHQMMSNGWQPQQQGMPGAQNQFGPPQGGGAGMSPQMQQMAMQHGGQFVGGQASNTGPYSYQSYGQQAQHANPMQQYMQYANSPIGGPSAGQQYTPAVQQALAAQFNSQQAPVSGTAPAPATGAPAPGAQGGRRSSPFVAQNGSIMNGDQRLF